MKIDGRILIGSDRDLNELMPRSCVRHVTSTQNDHVTLLGTDCIKWMTKRRPYQTKFWKYSFTEMLIFSSIESISPPTQCVGGSNFQRWNNFWITWPYWIFFKTRKFCIFPRKKFETLLIFTVYFFVKRNLRYFSSTSWIKTNEF